MSAGLPLLLAGLYVVTGIAVLADLDITPGSVRRHYQNVAVADEETASLMREHPAWCAAAYVFVYLLGLGLWPAVAWATLRRPA